VGNKAELNMTSYTYHGKKMLH